MKRYYLLAGFGSGFAIMFVSSWLMPYPWDLEPFLDRYYPYDIYQALAFLGWLLLMTIIFAVFKFFSRGDVPAGVATKKEHQIDLIRIRKEFSCLAAFWLGSLPFYLYLWFYLGFVANFEF